MTCEEYIIKELDETKDKLANAEWRLAELGKEMAAVGYVLAALVNRMKLKTYGNHRVISIDDIWENEHDFQAVYDHVKDLLRWEEKNNVEQSETCKPAES